MRNPLLIARLESGPVYMIRLYLPRGYMLNYFLRPDVVGAYHDHPWREGESRILFGSYREAVLYAGGAVEHRSFRRGDRRRFLGSLKHRVTGVSRFGCLTLFRAIGRSESGEWGFYYDNGEYFSHREILCDG